MKKATEKLSIPQYQLLREGFREWLTLLNYSELSIPGLTRTVEDFFCYQEATGKERLEQLTATDANGFIELLQAKGIYRNGHINKQIQGLLLLSRYLRDTGRSGIGFNLQRLEECRQKPVWLTRAEVQRLYEITGDDVLGIRDRAMLAVYYGCGLRLNEGAWMEVRDIDHGRKVLHVRKGKHYKERMVPIAQRSYEAIRLYLDYSRPVLLQGNRSEAFFIGANKGVRMNKGSLYVRIKTLVKNAGITKKAGTHSLRHSIATHLLASGMKLERIQQFLGHGDLDSTQIYTHLAAETAVTGSKWKFIN
jgi:site-specific recombinase XerD